MKPYYPLIPHLRYTGKKYLLLWHTHNEQNQVFLADSIEQSIELWNVALKAEGLEASPREFWNAQIVLPPDWIIENHNLHCYNEDYRNFMWHIEWDIKNYEKRHGKLPPNIISCQNTEHDNCECLGIKYKILGSSWKELFEQNWVPADKKKKLETFLGTEANLNSPLYVCELNGGHHNRGITFTNVERETVLRRDKVLFFFHGEKLEIPEEITESIKQLKQQKDLKRKQDELNYNLRQIAREQEEDDALFRTLGLK